jgi:hypothetical protein
VIPRVSYVLILVALGFTLLIAAASEGALDRLPPQPYFPQAFAERRQMPCDPVGALWPEQIVSTRTREPIVDAYAADWFGYHLRSGRELSLSDRSAQQNVDRLTVRFTWLPSFHSPVIVRVDESANGEMTLTAKRLSGRVGSFRGRTLTAVEAQAVRDVLRRTDVFNIVPLGCGGGVDGAQWLLEARDPRRYHFARRWSPQGGPVREVADVLLGLTGWKLDPIY